MVLAPKFKVRVAHRAGQSTVRIGVRLAVTLEVYTHEDRQAQHDALGKVSATLGQGHSPDHGQN